MKKPILLSFILALFCLNVAFSTTYYVDGTSGSDSNNGTSISTAWKTIAKVNSTSLAAGDNVLFARGQTFRGNISVTNSGSASAYISFGAYGTGNKPLLLGSIKRSNTLDWVSVGTNLWQTSNVLTINGEAVDAGNLIFNNEASVGWKVSSLSLANSQGKFYSNVPAKTVTVYSVGNPGTVYSNIEIALYKNSVDIGSQSYIIVENLDIRYTGRHGIGCDEVHHITIRDVDMSYIGGSYMTGVERLGNGVEFYGNAHDCSVDRCTFSQIYDAAVTNQGDQINCQEYNIYYRNNIISTSEYSFEVWLRGSGAQLHDIYFENNTCLDAGMGWGNAQREDPNGSHVALWGYSSVSLSNIFIRNNIFKNVNGAGIFEVSINLNNLTPSAVIINNNDWDVSPMLALMNWNTGLHEYHDWNYYRTNTGKDANSITANPLLNGFTIPSNSPCVNTGVTSLLTTTDFIGTSRPQGTAYDMGAYEFVGGISDTQTPTVPTGLASSAITSSSFTLNWTASTDNVAVTGYDVYKAGVLYGSTATTSINVTGLTASTAYSMTVKAKDAAANISAASAALNVTTSAASANIALNKVVTASSIEASTYPASYAVDGSGTTRWASLYADPQWIYVDLGAVYNINRVLLNWEAAYGSAYKVQVSNDASTWTDIFSTSTGDGGIDDLTGLSGTGRYVRMYGTTRATVYGYSLWDFEVYGTLSTSDTQAPTVPTGLASSAITSNSFNLSWTASSDNNAVTGYDVYKDGALYGSTTTATNMNITGQTASTAYSMTVKAKDAAGNISAASTALNVTTNTATYSNILVNPGFEIGTTPTPWYGNSSTIARGTTKNSGTYGCTVSARTSTSGGPMQAITSSVTALGSGIYYVEAWVRTASGTAAFMVTVTYTYNNVDYYANTSSVSVGTTWTKISGNINLAYTGTLQNCEFYVETTSGTANFYTDDCVMQFVSGSPTARIGVSLKDQNQDLSIDSQKIVVYPNPATNYLTAELPSFQENEEIQIYNSIGELVKGIKVSSKKQLINVEDLSNGIYFIHLKQQNSSVKFIKK